jgi:Tat protein secretion system quality control protein TatD with DNase activity
MLIDSHAHIDLSNFDRDREQVFVRARQGGIRAIINIGLDAESSRASLALARQHEDVFGTVGFHPHEADKMTDDDLKTLAELAKDEKVVAVGEIGLDFYRNLSSRQSQTAAFKKQLDLAIELGLPVVVHSRNAHREVYKILSGWVQATLAGGFALLQWRYRDGAAIPRNRLLHLAGRFGYLPLGGGAVAGSPGDTAEPPAPGDGRALLSAAGLPGQA